jgi:hypothetical protein
MPYKVTALKRVTFCVAVTTQIRVDLGNGEFYMKPGPSRDEWITLRAGEVRDGLGLVGGVHAKHGFGPPALQEGWNDGDLPKEFYGLYRLEISSASA